ncbi:MAG: hypothetical protein ACLPY5_02740 [Candidatus Bathyarchaeia archaeon]
MNKLGLMSGTILLVIALGVSPIPLAITLSDPTREVVLYPNVLFAVPLILLSALLLLYGVTTDKKTA